MEKKPRLKIRDLDKRFDYTPYQKRILVALALADCTPWHLAGVWWFGETVRKLRPIPAFTPEPSAAVAKAYRMSKALGNTIAGNHAGLLCSCLLWELLFPKEFPDQGVTRAAQALGLESIADDDSAWVLANIASNACPMRGWTFSNSSHDCVRLSDGELPG